MAKASDINNPSVFVVDKRNSSYTTIPFDQIKHLQGDLERVLHGDNPECDSRLVYAYIDTDLGVIDSYRVLSWKKVPSGESGYGFVSLPDQVYYPKEWRYD